MKVWNFEKLEVLVSDESNTEQLIGPVNLINLEQQILKERKFVEWNDEEFEIKQFCELKNRNELAHGTLTVKPTFSPKEKTVKMEDEIKDLVGKNRIEKALEILVENANEEFENAATQLKTRWKSIKKKEMLGIKIYLKIFIFLRH